MASPPPVPTTPLPRPASRSGDSPDPPCEACGRGGDGTIGDDSLEYAGSIQLIVGPMFSGKSTGAIAMRCCQCVLVACSCVACRVSPCVHGLPALCVCCSTMCCKGRWHPACGHNHVLTPVHHIPPHTHAHARANPFAIDPTTELQRRIRRYRHARLKCMVIKYKKDTRYSDTAMSTHDQTMMASRPCSVLSDIKDRELEGVNVIGIDEGQFFPEVRAPAPVPTRVCCTLLAGCVSVAVGYRRC